jgi:molybdenum cofactor cytidylyltransferase
MNAPDWVVVVLAAGLSRRMGGENKLLKPWRGKALIAWAAQTASAIPARAHILVTGPDSTQIVSAIQGSWTIARNPTPEDGLSGSLKCGLAAVGAGQAALIFLGDMPAIDTKVIAALAAAWRPDAFAIVPAYKGDWGNPVVLNPAAIVACADLNGDRGARALLAARAGEVIVVDVDHPGVLRDFDRPEDFTA